MNLLRLGSSIVIAGFASFSLTAGVLDVEGEGSSGHAPEYVSFTANVVARCYKTSKDASAAAAQLANQIKNELSKYAVATDLIKDPLVILPGYNSPNTETIYNQNTGRSETICSGWRNTNTLTLKLTQIDRLADVQDAVYALIDSISQGQQTDVRGPLTYATVNQPQPAVCDATAKTMELQAIQDATKSAKRKAAVFAKECGFTKLNLLKIAPRETQAAVRSMYRESVAAAAPMAPGGSSTPAQFGELSMSAAYRFTFSYEGGDEACSALK